jgi:hypothetical protein
MKESFPIALAAVAIAGAALALDDTVHNQATCGSCPPITGTPAQSALFKDGYPSEDRGRRSLFEICQHQDPTTPAIRFGTSGASPCHTEELVECFSLRGGIALTMVLPERTRFLGD